MTRQVSLGKDSQLIIKCVYADPSIMSLVNAI